MSGRVYGSTLEVVKGMSCQGVEFGYALYFITKQFYTQTKVGHGRKDFNSIAPHPEITLCKIKVIALVLDIHQSGQHFFALYVLGYIKHHSHIAPFFRTAQAVDTGYTGHHDHITSFHE